MAIAGQMNIRMDSTLKEQGDAVLAAAGFSPSQAVRALWKLALAYKDKPAQIASVLEPDNALQEESAHEAERARKLALVSSWEEETEGFYKQVGIEFSSSSELATLSYKQLRELAYLEERQEELGLTEEEIADWVKNED